MADSYEKVHERVETAGLMQKASLIHDWELLNIRVSRSRIVRLLSCLYTTPISGGFLYQRPIGFKRKKQQQEQGSRLGAPATSS